MSIFLFDLINLEHVALGPQKNDQILILVKLLQFAYFFLMTPLYQYVKMGETQHYSWLALFYDTYAFDF